MADYIDFIEMASQKPELTSEFVETVRSASPAELSEWFKTKGFNTPIEECVRIMESSNKKGKNFVAPNATY